MDASGGDRRGAEAGRGARLDRKVRIVQGTRYFINVGSVGQPRDRVPHASYCVVDQDAKTIELARAGVIVLCRASDVTLDEFKAVRAELKAMHKELSASLAKADRQQNQVAEKLGDTKVARQDLAKLLRGVAESIHPEKTGRGK